MAGKSALVLSAGGLFGAYQVGAWKHLSQVWRPDIVVGASIGAVNGWQIASDCSGSRLEKMWLDPNIGSLIQIKPKPGLRRGYFDPEPLLEGIRKIHGGCRPNRPYWAVVVEVPSFRTRLIPAEQVLPEHLLASCSIYLFYPTVRIGNRRFTDGGLLGHLPLWAAAKVGATKIIAIDCLPKMSPWWVRGTISTLHLLRPRRQLPPDIFVLRPSEHLGDTPESMTYDAARIRRWIELGEKDAQRAFPRPFD